MKAEAIEEALRAAGIPLEEERAVPCNGIQKELPYMVIRQERTIDGDDAGRVRLEKISWTVVLFSRNKAPELNRKILIALAGVGAVREESFPDGTPYQTNFEFKTTQIIRGGK